MWPPLLSIDFVALTIQRLFSQSIWVSLWYLWDGSNRYGGHPALPWLSLAVITASALIYLWPYLERLQYGSPRHINFSDEVVVITGGSRGLGWLIAQLLASRGAAVVVLDIIAPERGIESEGVAFIQTDIGDEQAVQKAKDKIVKELGPPTILINNAGVVNGKTMLTLDSAAIEKTFRVNLLSHFHTIRAFIPGMLAMPGGGTIVTVSSILGVLGAAQLTDYAASKAGLNAMHASLRAELDGSGHSNIKTILVKPGQLGTSLFGGVKTPSEFLGPVVPPEALARAIVQKIAGGQTGHIALPLYAQFGEVLTLLPLALENAIRRIAGVDRAMSTFRSKEM